MNPNRFFMPGYMGMANNAITSPMMRMTNNAIINPMIRMAGATTRGMGLFSRITNSIRSINWGSLLNNANKTLDVVNQAIPLVRQAGPMVSNMRSMLRIAKAFGSETTDTRTSNNRNISSNLANNINSNSNNNVVNNVINSDTEDLVQKKEELNSNSPNFFV